MQPHSHTAGQGLEDNRGVTRRKYVGKARGHCEWSRSGGLESERILTFLASELLGEW
jgi:hypothetical protein